MKRFKRAIALLAAISTVISGIPVYAATNDMSNVESELTDSMDSAAEAYEGYTLVWSDEFNDAELNREDWNVETHDPGWVNSELQEYVDSTDNIKITTDGDNGILNIIPTKEETSVEVVPGNILKNANFTDGKADWETSEDWGTTSEFTSTPVAGGINFNITNGGNADWNVQLKQKVTIDKSKTYTGKATITSSISRRVKIGVLGTGDSWYGGTEVDLVKDVPKKVTFAVAIPTGVELDSDAGAAFFGSFGNNIIPDTSYDAHSISVSGISLVENGDAEIPGNKIINGKFVKGKDGWTDSIGWDPAPDFSVDYSNKAAVLSINSVGTANWHVQLKQGVDLKPGKSYKVNFTAEASIDRKIESSVMGAGDAYYNGTTESLEAGVAKEVEYEVDVPNGATGISFSVSMGKIAGDLESYPEHEIKITNVSVLEKPAAFSYKSGRITTQGKKTFTYGRFEARAKVPTGQGYLPAFWLMANDENIYGQWPRCGEIDCMEVMGQETNKVYGTIHYGNPHNENQGTNVVTDGPDYAEAFHTYTCDWEPGKITWYVDGVKYYETSDWYSTTEGQGTIKYPAPFDQDFYIILNLAVGGSWVGNPDESTSFDNNPYQIDYVRVYQKTDGYDEDVERPEKEPVEFREADATGNYIINGDFAEAEDLIAEKDWVFKTALGGEATAEIKDSTIEIKTTADGSEDYSVQLYQANVPLLKGAKYEVSFDAKASANRTMNVDVKAPDRGYAKYMDTKKPAITTTNQTFTYDFVMTGDDDANGRLEFNMGATGSTADVTISKVSLKMIDGGNPDPNEGKKGLLSNGSYIYNGKFQEGKNYLGYWDVTKGSASKAAVTSLSDGRQLEVSMPADATVPFVLAQKELGFKEGLQYSLRFTASTSKTTKLNISVGGKNSTVTLSGNGLDDKKEYEVTIPSTARFLNKDVSFTLADKDVTVKLDNISLMEAGLLTNGSFNSGLTGFEVYVNDAASCSYVVDSLNEDNAIDFTINNAGTENWHIQLLQYVSLEKGKTYRLSYDAKSSINREIFAQIQKNGGDYDNYSKTSPVALTNEYQTFSSTFTMDYDSDAKAKFNICLGTPTGADAITEQHRVVIDNIILEEVGEAPTPGGDDVDDSERILEIPDYEYTGAKIKPAVKVYDGEKLLKNGTDYTLSYFNNTNVNEVRKVNAGMDDDFDETLPYVVITGKGNYSGVNKVNFNITHKVIADNNNAPKTGVAIAYTEQLNQNKNKVQPVFSSLKVGKTTLKKDRDYTVSLSKNGLEVANAKIPMNDSGVYTLTVTGKGNYTGSIIKTVYVASKANLIKNASITIGNNIKSVKYTGKNIVLTPGYYNATDRKTYAVSANGIGTTPVDAKDVFLVKEGNVSLQYGKDYTVSYTANKSVGKATMTITGKGEYYGSKSVNFNITGMPFNANKVVVTGLKAETYTGSPIIATDARVAYKVSATDTKPLILNNHYTMTYKNNIKKGTATITFAGKPSAGYTGSFKKTFKINADSMNNVNDLTPDVTVAYTKAGAKIDDSIKLVVSANGRELVRNVDYKVTYTDNKKVAAKDATKAPTAKITGINNYTGTKLIKFTIVAADIDTLTVTATPVMLDAKGTETKKYSPAVVVKDGSKTLAKNTDYTVEYMNNTQADVVAFLGGDASKKPVAKITAKASTYTGSKTIDLQVYANKLTKKNTIILVDEVTYTGAQVKPDIAVYYAPTNEIFKAGKNLKTGAELEAKGFVKVLPEAYSVKWGKNVKYGVNAGSVTVTGTNKEFGGSITVKFNINRKAIK